MSPRARKVCPVLGCFELTAGGRCPQHTREADTTRGTATQRGYASAGHRAFRTAVLERDPVCVVCNLALATVADHWPTSRRDLEAAGQDPNDPRHGRGVCHRCHSRETARNQPGGWHTPGG